MKIECRLRRAAAVGALAVLGLAVAGATPAASHNEPKSPDRDGYRRRTASAPRVSRYSVRHDRDRDGIPNWNDGDIDGDGIANARDRRPYTYSYHGKRHPRSYGKSHWKDVDRDGIPNWRDRDIDGDGKRNARDRDKDGDGRRNGRDHQPRNSRHR